MYSLIATPLIELGSTQIEFEGLKTTNIVDKETKSRMKKLEETNKQFHYGLQTPVANFFSQLF